MNKEHLDGMYVALTILCCPDCEAQLSELLSCPRCRRSFEPADDGIIRALPRALEAEQQSKDKIQNLIEAEGPGEHGQRVVAFERAFHDEQAPFYDKLFADPLPIASYYRHLVGNQIYSQVTNSPFVVDLCCGTGKSSLPLAKRGIFVVAIDVSLEMLRVYRRKCLALGIKHVIFIHADASRPPLRSGSCGAVMMIGGLHHIREQSESVRRCCNALTQGGVLILHEPLKTGKQSRGGAILENVYAVADLPRAWRAVRRRLGLPPPPPSVSEEPELADFTPFEQPFSSAHALQELMPSAMRTLILRSQGGLSFREFPKMFQNAIGVPLAWLIVELDRWERSQNPADWSGDAIFAVFRKSD